MLSEKEYKFCYDRFRKYRQYRIPLRHQLRKTYVSIGKFRRDRPAPSVRKPMTMVEGSANMVKTTQDRIGFQGLRELPQSLKTGHLT